MSVLKRRVVLWSKTLISQVLMKCQNFHYRQRLEEMFEHKKVKTLITPLVLVLKLSTYIMMTDNYSLLKTHTVQLSREESEELC